MLYNKRIILRGSNSMKKAEFYINTFGGKKNGEYPKVSGYIEEITDNSGIHKLLIGYDNRYHMLWMATELHTGMYVNCKTTKTKTECIEYVHNHTDMIVEAYNKCINNEKCYQERIKPFVDFVNANGGIIQ